jgi:hypothetical protein
MHTSPLISALLGLANSMPSLPRIQTNRQPASSGRKKTKKGATHIVWRSLQAEVHDLFRRKACNSCYVLPHASWRAESEEEKWT